ncbi:MAG: hypothetical protein ACFFBP_20135 [Promethearchaeota archaeon]
MFEDNTTDGLPTSDLFDLTAPNNEYLTDVESSFSTSVEFVPLEIYSPVKSPSILEPIDFLNELKYSEKLYNVKIDKNNEYSTYVHSEELILIFSEILEEFLSYYFKLSYYKPITCELTMFVFPGEEYEEPMIKIIYPNSNDFNNLKIRDDIEEKFKLFLVNKSEDLEQYKKYRQIQKKFRFIIQRE